MTPFDYLTYRQRVSPEDKPLAYALLFSLLIHAWLSTLVLGGWKFWLPGFGFSWDRRIEAPDLRVVVVSPSVTAEPMVPPAAEPEQPARVEQPVVPATTPTPSASRSTRRRTTAAIVPKAEQKAEANPKTNAAIAPTPAQPPLRADRPADNAPSSIPTPAVIAVAPIDEPTWMVPTTPAMLPPAMAPTPSAQNRQTASDRPVELVKPEPSRQAEQLEAARREVARLEEAQSESARQAAQVEAARVEAERAEATRVEAARAETARVEAARAEVARVEAARAEAARVEAARVEAARAETARVEAARAEAARVEAARVEAARAEAARIEAARVEAERADAERREAARIAMGRQLDAEAAQREAATAPTGQSRSLPPPWSSARRYRLFGRADPNAELIQYAEAWAVKIQLNPKAFDMVREAAKQRHSDPLVWVAIRSDGSVESVTFDQSSGVGALDEAIRRVVDTQRPYPAFPPGLAREYDVIEIRRTWHFDTAIRLY